MNSPLTIDQVVRAPECVTRKMTLTSGKELLFRLLRRDDAQPLGKYFEELSEATRRLYGPHAFSVDTAKQLCAELDHGKTMRLLAVSNGRIVAYFIVVVGLREQDKSRYEGYGLSLDGRFVCTLAPSVADAWQNTGLGSAMMGELIPMARRLGFRRMVLFEGTQATNERAVHFYRKFGFRQVGEFKIGVNEAQINNFDMILDL